MSRRRKQTNGHRALLTLLIATLLAFLTGADRPNILLIITDDQGWGDLSAHGNPWLRTPHLDGLRTAGARLERFFVSPVCAPTRAALLTGRYYLRTGVHGVTRGFERMRAEEITLAEALREHGYVTACFGKWHNGAQYPHHPNGQGFDEFVGFCAGHWNNYFDPVLEHNGVPFQAKGHVTDVLTDYAIAFIRQNKDRPFFCYLAYNAPHSPFQVPDRYFEKYRRLGLDPTLASVYAMCEQVDAAIGRILRALRDLGLDRHTIIVFTTDNGPNTNRFNGDMRGRKGSVDEGGVRVPCFIVWSGVIAPNTEIDAIAADIDIMPTLLDLAGLPPPPNVPFDGRSLKPLLTRPSSPWPSRLLFQHWSGPTVRPDRGAVRSQRYRAVNRRGRWELYDMTTDPSQSNDIAQERPEVLEQLVRAYEAWYEDVTRAGFDPIPIEVGHPGWDQVVLPAHEAFLEPGAGHGIRYHGGRGWANDWITGWTSTSAYAWWPLKVVRDGTYEFSLRYSCSPSDVGSIVELRLGQQRLRSKIARPFVGKVIPSPDRVPRREVPERTWGAYRLGSMKLSSGSYRLELRAVRIPSRQVGDIKALVVRRIGPSTAFPNGTRSSMGLSFVLGVTAALILHPPTASEDLPGYLRHRKLREQIGQQLPVATRRWMSRATSEILAGCQLRAFDGTTLYAPDTSGHYPACWLRDFTYMVQYAGDLLQGPEVRRCIVYLLDRQRRDGVMPDRVDVQGRPVYGPGPVTKPLADHALDNNAFAVQLVAAYVDRWGDLELFRQLYPRLARALDQTPLSDAGLVYNDPNDPMCPYGFTDTVRKTGELLFCSVLYYRACLDLARLAEASGVGDPQRYRRRAARIRENLVRLWDSRRGIFVAATGDCRQPDVWGSAYAAWEGLANAQQRRQIATYLARHHARIFLNGHVRHLPAPQSWQKLFIRVRPGTYQNGAYWTVPLPWVVSVLSETDERWARRLVREAIAEFRERGIYECITAEGTGRVRGYAASATNVYWLVAAPR